jgi:hypothetical protein
MSNQNSLENIYRMITPANLIAAEKVSSSATEASTTGNLLNILYGTGNSGANSIEELRKQITDLLSGDINEDELKTIKKVLKFYSTGPQITIDKLAESSRIYDNDASKKISSMKELFNSTSDLEKSFAIILSNTPYINPSVRNVEKAEIFLNYIPSLFASRMVPYFEAEFEYQEQNLDISQRSSQIKFLLGNDSSAVNTDANKAMINAVSRRQKVQDKENPVYGKYAGMEMFTSPQTLVNPDSVQFNKYTQVLDPFRPFASIESFDISVESTVGLFSYKKGTMVIKVHDKSRLSELSEFVQPQLANLSYLRVKYGWIYPQDDNAQNADGSSTYGDFINNNLTIEETYSVINSSFAFDSNGQVTITLQISMRTANALRHIKHSDDKNSSLDSLRKIKGAGKEISRLLKELQFNTASGALSEIRGFEILDAAQHGQFPPDLSAKETNDLLQNLKKMLQKNTVNPGAARQLADQLSALYSISTSKTAGTTFARLDQVKNEALQKVQKRFNDLATGPDPFLVSDASYAQFKTETGMTADHPFLELINKYNNPPKDSKNQKKGAAPQVEPKFKKKLVSFGKLFSVFAGQSLQTLDGVDEFQVYFYSFNENAGRASSTNIAEFPIELDIFLDHYREHVETRGTTDLTLEQFLMLVRDSQMNDIRALAYGFKDYFMPFEFGKDPSAIEKTQPQFEAEFGGFTGKYGPFKKPVIEFYAETITKNVKDVNDVSKQSIFRLHIFDKNMTPHKKASQILKSDDSEQFFESSESSLKSFVVEMSGATEEVKSEKIKQLTSKNSNGTTNILLDKGFNLNDIKKLVTRTVPTIIIGANASMVKNADLSSTADALTSTIQMQNQNKGVHPSPARPNGSAPNGFPLRVIPASLNLVMFGCPLMAHSQQYFIDFSTGTTLDAIYNVTGLKHTISPGRFETTVTFTFADGYGQYTGASKITDYVSSQLKLLAAQTPAPPKAK